MKKREKKFPFPNRSPFLDEVGREKASASSLSFLCCCLFFFPRSLHAPRLELVLLRSRISSRNPLCISSHAMRAMSATPRQLGAAARAPAAEREGRGATRRPVAVRAAAARSGRSSSPPPSPRSRSAASTTSTTASHAVSSSSPVVAAVAAVETGTKGGSGTVADAEVLSKSDIPASIAAAQAALRAVAALESMTTQLESLTVRRVL